MKNLTGKNIQLWIKNNYSLEEVADLIDETVEDTKEIIRRRFSRNSEAFIRALQNNKGTRLKSKKLTSQTDPSVTEKCERIDEESQDTNTNNTSLNELKRKVEEQQQATIKKELEAKKLREQYRANLKEVTVLYGMLEEMKDKISSIKVKLEEIDKSSMNLAEMHENVIEELHQEKKKLSILRNELEERSVVQILVYADGTIVGEQDGESYQLNFEGWEKYQERLMEDDCYEVICNLKLKEISQLAKLLKFVNETKIEYIITFDSAEMEAVFDCFTEDVTSK